MRLNLVRGRCHSAIGQPCTPPSRPLGITPQFIHQLGQILTTNLLLKLLTSYAYQMPKECHLHTHQNNPHHGITVNLLSRSACLARSLPSIAIEMRRISPSRRQKDPSENQPTAKILEQKYPSCPSCPTPHFMTSPPPKKYSPSAPMSTTNHNNLQI